MVLQMFFFVSTCVTCRLVERLTALLGNKDKNPGNEEVLQLVKIYKNRILQHHTQRNMYHEMKEEITSQKKNKV